MNVFKSIQDPSPLSTKSAIWLLLSYFLIYFFAVPFIMVAIDELLIKGFSTNGIVDVAVHTLFTLLFLYLSRDLRHESTKHWSRFALYIPIISAVAMIYGSALINEGVSLISGQSEPLNQALLFQQFQANRMPIMVEALIFAPIVEEIVFRGVIYRHFKKAGRYLIPLIVSTLLFAAMHSLSAIVTGQWSDLWYIPVYAYMSLILTYTYEKTQNLYSSMFLHFINNAISIIAMFYVLK